MEPETQRRSSEGGPARDGLREAAPPAAQERAAREQSDEREADREAADRLVSQDDPGDRQENMPLEPEERLMETDNLRALGG